MSARERDWKKGTGGTEMAEVVQRRYWEVNGGRQAYQIIIDDAAAGMWECGPFGHHDITLQFASLTPENPFNGTFEVLVGRSLRPGETSYRAQGYDEDSTVGGPMHPRGGPEDYLAEVGVSAVGIMTIPGPAGRVRVLLADFNPGTGGKLACWVL